MDIPWLKILVFLIVFSLISCDITKTVDYDIDYSTDKLAVTGFIGSEYRAEVFVSTSHHPLEDENDTLNAAEVLLFEEGKYVTNLTKNKESIYITEGFIPQKGRVYSLKVNVSGYPEVYSEPEFVPNPVRIDSVNYFINLENELYLSSYFIDPPGQNYYFLKIIRSYNDTLVDKTDARTRLFNTGVFSDKLFQSQMYNYERTVSLEAGRYNGENIHYNRIYIVLYSISESGYKFFKSLNEFDYTHGDMFTAPAEIYSNINYGYGIFAAYSTDTMKIKLDL